MKNASTFIKNKIFVYTIILGIAVAISLVVAPLSVGLFEIIFIAFLVFAFNPPELPIFIDNSNTNF